MPLLGQHTLYGIMQADMNAIQAAIKGLQDKGWTLAAIARELDVTPNAVEKWKAGHREPQNAKLVLGALNSLASRKYVPKRRVYEPESRTRRYPPAD